MKHLFTYLLINLIFASSIIAQGFIHPGALHTEADFVRIRQQIADGNTEVLKGWENLKNNEWSQSNVGTWPTEIIKRGVTGDENYMNAARGGTAAYQNALRWKISGDVAHANRAVEILNAWAAVCKGVGGNTNLSLASGLYGFAFANAGELMRDYEGWAEEDFKKFQQFMLDVFYPASMDFLKRRHDTLSQGRPGHYWANWGLCNALCIISIGILCDDVYVYNEGMSYYKYDKIGTFQETKTAPIINDGFNEFLGNMIPVIHPDERGPYGYLGQTQESGRDQGHTTMLLGLAVDIAQTGWNQGDDLFAHMDNRLAAGIEFVAAYNNGIDDLPWTEYWYHDVRTAVHNSWKQTEPNGGARGQIRPYWDRIIGHYEGIKGVDMPFSQEARAKIGADWGSGGGTSGGYDHLGLTTLTCTRPKVTAQQAPTSLKTEIIYKGKTYKQGELNNVTKGETLELIPILPDGESDTGNWLWSDGETTKNIEIEANTSKLYRVKYTNSNGVEGVQLFSIHVDGEGAKDKLTPVIDAEGDVTYETSKIVKQNSQVRLEVWSQLRYAQYQWEDGSTNSYTTINVGKDDVEISVIVKTEAGVAETVTFLIMPEPLSASYIVDEENEKDGNIVPIVVGQNVILKPHLKNGFENGEWLWSNGATSSQLSLENIQDDIEMSVEHSINGEKYEIFYIIKILPFAEAWAYWPMDELTFDLIDQWGEWHSKLNTGQKIKAMSDRGSRLTGTANSYITMPDDILSNLEDFTIALWVNPTELAQWSRIWDFGRGTEYNMFLTTTAGDGYIRYSFKTGSITQDVTTTTTLREGEWNHIAVTKSNNKVVIYLDGKVIATNNNISLTPSDLGYTNQNYVGKSQYGADPNFKGIVDEMRIYRSALNIDEINELIDAIRPSAPTNINATASGNNIQLEWTAAENATAYTIMRSENIDSDFEEIRTGLTTVTYRDRDNTLNLEKRYYYYVISENNGFKGEASEIATFIPTNIYVNKNDLDFSLSPNPFKDIIKLNINGLSNIGYKLKISNLSGKVIFNKANNNAEEIINLSELQQGFYILQVIDNLSNEIVKTEKLLKL